MLLLCALETYVMSSVIWWHFVLAACNSSWFHGVCTMMGQGLHLPLKKHRFLEHSVVANIAIQDILSNSFVLMLSKIAVVALNGLQINYGTGMEKPVHFECWSWAVGWNSWNYCCLPTLGSLQRGIPSLGSQLMHGTSWKGTDVASFLCLMLSAFFFRVEFHFSVLFIFHNQFSVRPSSLSLGLHRC